MFEQLAPKPKRKIEIIDHRPMSNGQFAVILVAALAIYAFFAWLGWL